VSAVRLSRNFGKEAALAAGLERAAGEAIVVMDGDLQHPPCLIREMLRHWRDGAEVVEGVKEDRGRESLISRFQAELFYGLFTKLTGFDLRGASDFKLLDRRVLGAWRQMGEHNLFFRGMTAWLGFRRVTVPFTVNARIDGTSQWSTLALTRLAINAVTSFTSAPLYMLNTAGIVFLVFAMVLGLHTLTLKISGRAVDGFSTVILLLLIMGSAIMLGLGVIGVYLARIYEEAKNRPRFVVAEHSIAEHSPPGSAA
jgi:glycosyltransferase involved in cell wall biosynthesis